MRVAIATTLVVVGAVFSNAQAESRSKFYEAAKVECAKLHPQVYTSQKDCIEDYQVVHLWAERAGLLTGNGHLDRAAIQRRREAKDPKAIILGHCLEQWWDDTTAPGRWQMIEYCVRTEQEAYEAIYGKLFK